MPFRDFVGLVVSDRARHDVEVDTDRDPWVVVGETIRARRVGLGLTQQKAGAEAGVGTTVWGELEGGKRTNYTPRILGLVCKELEWSADSIARILRGEKPIVVPKIPQSPPSTQTEVDAIEHEVGLLIGELARRARGQSQ